MATGPLIILSGPSGSGKSTVIRRLLAEGGLRLRLSVSATTRPPRPGEKDGVHYYFWTTAQFEKELAAGGFLEWAQVVGNYYGTLIREVAPYREQGVGVLLDIDVQGWEQVRRRCPDAVSIFLRPPSLEILEERLRARSTETEAAIERRLERARAEMARASEYDYCIVNDNLDTAVAQIRAIMERHCDRSK
jgi:guanylate kinase